MRLFDPLFQKKPFALHPETASTQDTFKKEVPGEALSLREASGMEELENLIRKQFGTTTFGIPNTVEEARSEALSLFENTIRDNKDRVTPALVASVFKLALAGAQDRIRRRIEMRALDEKHRHYTRYLSSALLSGSPEEDRRRKIQDEYRNELELRQLPPAAIEWAMERYATENPRPKFEFDMPPEPPRYSDGTLSEPYTAIVECAERVIEDALSPLRDEILAKLALEHPEK